MALGSPIILVASLVCNRAASHILAATGIGRLARSLNLSTCNITMNRMPMITGAAHAMSRPERRRVTRTSTITLYRHALTRPASGKLCFRDDRKELTDLGVRLRSDRLRLELRVRASFLVDDLDAWLPGIRQPGHQWSKYGGSSYNISATGLCGASV